MAISDIAYEAPFGDDTERHILITQLELTIERAAQALTRDWVTTSQAHWRSKHSSYWNLKHKKGIKYRPSCGMLPSEAFKLRECMINRKHLPRFDRAIMPCA